MIPAPDARPDLPDASELGLTSSQVAAERYLRADGERPSAAQILRAIEMCRLSPDRARAILDDLAIDPEDVRRAWRGRRRGAVRDSLRVYFAHGYDDNAAHARYGGVRGSTATKNGPSIEIQERDAIARALPRLKRWDPEAYHWTLWHVRDFQEPDDIARRVGTYGERHVAARVREALDFLAELVIGGEAPL